MNARKRIRWGTALAVAALFLGACGILPQGPGPGAAGTAAAQTVVAQMTAIAGRATPTPSVPPASPTVVVTETPTEPPAPTPTATPTAAPLPCNWAAFVTDVTVPDGTELEPGEAFTKTWRLRNAGRCTWTSGYDLVFVEGKSMGGPAAIALPEPVSPGERVDVSVALTAPTAEGSYRGEWALRDSAGVLFGLGSDRRAPFWVEIEVVDRERVAYDFVEAYCEADWHGSFGALPCPGSPGARVGSVVEVGEPALEYTVENEAGLSVHPAWVEDGVIAGTYPAVRIEEGDRFEAVTACMAEGEGCEVWFQLNYRIGDGSLKNLHAWVEGHDGRPTHVSVDLSALEGEDVRFVLMVSAMGEARADRAFWLAPRIVR